MMAAGIKGLQAEKGYPIMLGANRINGGYNFAVEASGKAEVSLILYRKHSKTPSCEIPFGEEHRTGRVYAISIRGITDADYEYNYRIDGKVCQDRCAYSIRGREHFGAPVSEDEHKVRCGLLPEAVYDWEEDRAPGIRYEDMILYKLHVRGYTKLAGNNVKKKGTFSGLTEMIPYWKELGINTIELMPAYEFQEVSPPNAMEEFITEKRDENKVNYWGYMPGFYFAPKSAYCCDAKEPENEFRDFIKALHKAGMECIMEFYFAGKTSPVEALRALQFWKSYYHVDGFHVQGDNLSLDVIVKDTILADTKLMVAGYDFGSLYNGKAPENRTLAEYNTVFLQDMRRFLKSDEDMAERAAWHVRRNSNDHGVINFMACQDGFTLNDMVSYNYKHNEANGEENQDGGSYNYSWNCGVEGSSRKLTVKQMRERQMRNAFLMVLLSQGVPMIYGGDEIANSQEGNNNAWCQDNPIGWTDWKGQKKNSTLLKFVQEAIAFRKAHPILHLAEVLKGSDYLAKGFPDISFHGERAWYVSYENTCRLFGVMYCGAYGSKEKTAGSGDEFIYVGYNFHWEERCLALPNLPEGMKWVKTADTGEITEGSCFTKDGENYTKSVPVSPRTIVVLLGRKEITQ